MLEFPIIHLFINMFVFLIYLALFGLLYLKSTKQFGKTWELTLLLCLFALCVALSSLTWGVKALIIQVDASVEGWVWFWRLSITFLLLGAFLLGIFGLQLLPPPQPKYELQKKLLRYGVTALPIPVFFSFLLATPPSSLVVVTIFQVGYVKPPLVVWLFGLLAILYTALPTYSFLSYLSISSFRVSPKGRRGARILFGLISFGLGSFFGLTQVLGLLSSYEVGYVISQTVLALGGLFLTAAFISPRRERVRGEAYRL